jgi:hypothetical protein
MIPLFGKVSQHHEQPEIADVSATTLKAWREAPVASRLKSGMSVAVGVGSRGIVGLQSMVKATLEFLREKGCSSFIVSAMGSHGGANAKGQRELLGEYGISEEALGVPVKSDMDSVVIGTNSWGEPVYWDKNALKADAVLTISRIKPHTDFRGKFESGILKMLVIGLGKRDGASQHHRWGFKGLRDMMPETGKVILEKTPFQAGLAILENARERTARLEVIDRAQLFTREPQLLDDARKLMGRLPFPQLDLLIIGEIGKNYSGAGIDPNVVGRLLIETQPEDPTPCITRMCCLDLSPESHGNGTGVGIADLTTERLLASIDPVPFRMNNLTACFLWRSKLPIGFSNDTTCIEQGIITSWQPRMEELRIAIIPNTLELETLWVSPKLWEESASIGHLRRHGNLASLPFDSAGNLLQEQLFPESVRGRRKTGKH